MRKYGESKTTRIMMATVPHVTFGLGLRKFQADGCFVDTCVRVVLEMYVGWMESNASILTTSQWMGIC